MSFIPKPYEIYKHFKGNLYQIITTAEHSETGEILVIYQALYGDFKIYARPLNMFTSKVDKEKYPDTNQEFRFELQELHKVQPENLIEKEEKKPKKVQEDKGIQENIENTKSTTTEEQECFLDPMVVQFLDADSYEQKLNILTALHHRITDEMITTMAICCDIEVPEGKLEERYMELKSCLLTLQKYEGTRLR